MSLKFSSPREEALIKASQARDDIIEGKKDAASIIRSCLVVATLLNKTKEEKWLVSELNGYSDEDESIPWCRNVSFSVVEETYSGDRFIRFEWDYIRKSIHLLCAQIKSNSGPSDLKLLYPDKKIRLLKETSIKELLNTIMDQCLFFLNNTISELQYGGVVELLMEEIRRNTDEKLITLDSNIKFEITSLFNNLNSTNKADWNKVGHSCRKLLKLTADKVFPASDELYKFKYGKTTCQVKDNNYINRLCAFMDQNTIGDERILITGEINYFEKYLKSINEFDNEGEHKKSIEKYQANMMAIYTYLILSEILKHYKKESINSN